MEFQQNQHKSIRMAITRLKLDRIDSNLLCMESHDSNQLHINSNRHEFVGMALKYGEWFGNAMDWSRLSKMGRNMEIGLEFGSAGPIWMRLLFIWPDPILMVML